MDDKTIRIRRFTSADDFRAWWASDEARQARQANPDMLKQHPLVKPWLEKLKPEEAAGQILGKYRLERKLGQGGMGVVYLALDQTLNRHVALKIITSSDPELVERFQREAQAVAKLKHPNIVQIYEAGNVDKNYYFAMEYVDGTSLDTVINSAKRISFANIARITIQVALALSYAHKHRIIHRDIKPGNILIDKRGKIYLTDFGLAKQLTGLDRSLTMSGTTVGTPDYMSPEQAQGMNKEIDECSDIFSLGATLYHCLTGQIPFRGQELLDILNKVVNNDPPMPSSIVKTIPPALETICLKCLNKEKNRRYQNSRELAQDLKRYLDGEPILARRTSYISRLWVKAKRNKTASMAIAATMLILIGLSVYWAISSLNTREQLAIYRFQAEEFFDQDKWLEAKEMCDRILEIAPADTATDGLRDKCIDKIRKKDLRTTADKEKAIFETERLKAQSEREEKISTMWGKFNATNLPEKQLKIAQELIDFDPAIPDGYIILGYAHQGGGNPDKAFDNFSRAIELMPASSGSADINRKLSNTHYARGWITYSHRDDFEGAATDLKKVVEYAPDSSIAHMVQGIMEHEKSNYDSAIQHLSRSIEIDDNYADAYAERGRAYSARQQPGDLQRAIADYTESIRLNPQDYTSYNNRGIAYFNDKNWEQAIADYTEALKLRPSSSATYSNRANAYKEVNQRDKAIADYTEAIRLLPNNEHAYYGRAMTYAAKGDFKQALADAEIFLKISNDNMHKIALGFLMDQWRAKLKQK